MAANKPINALVFSKTSGYRHSSINTAVSAFQSLATRTKLVKIDVSEDAEIAMTAHKLELYDVVILLHCTGDFLSSVQVNALKTFVRSGGGIVAIHGAAAAMLGDAWYGSLIGAHFDSHPEPEAGAVIVEDADHWILGGLGSRKGWMDEWYNFRTHPRKNPKLKVLLKGDVTTFQGGKMGEDHPLVWCQEFEGGRSFFTALGHFDEAYSDEWFMSQILRAIFWVANSEHEFDGDIFR